MAPPEPFHRCVVRLAPLFVLADVPRLRGEYALVNLERPETPSEVPPAHQLRPADGLLLSESDLAAGQRRLDSAVTRLQRLHRPAQINNASARSGEGLEEVRRLVERGGPASARR